MLQIRCHGHVAHGTSQLYTSVRSLRDLHSLGPSALGCVNSVETCTSVYNLYIHVCMATHNEHKTAHPTCICPNLAGLVPNNKK